MYTSASTIPKNKIFGAANKWVAFATLSCSSRREVRAGYVRTRTRTELNGPQNPATEWPSMHNVSVAGKESHRGSLRRHMFMPSV